MTIRHARLSACVALAVFAAVSAVAVASPSLDLHDGGDTHEGIGQADTVALRAGASYRASAFSVALRLRPPDGRWGGAQYHSGKFRFVQLNHHRTGKVPLHGVGYITLESAQTHTAPVAVTIARLHATPHLSVSAIKTVRVAGIAAEMFDATVVGTDGPDTGNGVSLVPFTINRHCGFCNDAAKHPSKETQDVKYAGKGQLFRIIVLDAGGKTVVIYLESGYADQPRFPPAKTFPTFLPYAQKMLASMHFSG